VAKLELFGAARCPTRRRCASGWSGSAAISWNMTWRPILKRARRMSALAAGQRSVPVLVEDGKVVQIGWQRTQLHDRGGVTDTPRTDEWICTNSQSR
jgi:hypothetical protein